MFNIEPLTAGCGTLLPDAKHVCIGVSPFNSYFSTERLIRLAEWAFTHFDSCHFFIPDAVAAYTLEALGYTPERARQKTQRQGRYIHNKVVTALRTLGTSQPDELILDMERLIGNARYCELLNTADSLFENDDGFRAACLDASHWVLDRRLPPQSEPGESQLRCAARYFLAELPLFADSGGIVGHSPSMFVYHQRVRFLERFYRRELSWSPASAQGFLVVHEQQSPARDGVLVSGPQSGKVHD